MSISSLMLSRIIGRTGRVMFAQLRKAREFIPNVIIYRCVNAQNKNEDQVSRNPRQSKTVPEWSHWEVAVCALPDICVPIVDEG